MFSLEKIIGKKVVSLKNHRVDMRCRKNLEVNYILFDDKETIIIIENGTNNLSISEDKQLWKTISSDTRSFPDANCDPVLVI